MGQTLADRIREAIQARAAAAARGVELGSFLELRVGEADARAIVETLEAIGQAQERNRGGDRLLHLAAVLDGKELTMPELGISGSETPSTMARTLADAAVYSVTSTLGQFEGTPLEEVDEARTFFERPLGHPADLAFVASVVSVALPEADDEKPRVGADVAAAAVDAAAQAVKAAHKAFAGEMGAVDAASWWLDRVVAGIEVVVDRAARVGLERGGQALGAVLGSFLRIGPAAAVIGQTLGRMAGDHVATPLAKACGELARRVLPKVGEAVKTWVVTATEKARAWLGR